MRALMRAHLDDAHERGDPLAALWASEETIYPIRVRPRGVRGRGRRARQHAAFGTPLEREGTTRLVDAAEALESFPPLWDELARARPGVLSRSRGWWEHRVLADPPERRHGSGPKRIVVLDLGGPARRVRDLPAPDGVEPGPATGQVVVAEAIAVSTQASAELWRFLLDIDWAATTVAALLPPDHPLVFLLAQPRAMRYRMGDGLWVRLVDVGAALSGRTYPDDRELCSKCATSSARGTRLAGASPAAPPSGRTPRPTSPSTSQPSVLRTSAGSGSPSSPRAAQSRS